MKCPNCGAETTRVLDSRNSNDKTYVKRRRVCEACNYKFTTYEKMPEFVIFVLKKDGSRQIFSRNKVFAGIKKCCEKRNIQDKEIESVIDSIEKDIRQKSTQIGELVLKYLKSLDEVSYVRFAAVYKDFKDIKSFMEYLQREF